MSTDKVDKPWLNRRIWKSGRIKNRTFKSFVALFSVAVLFSLLAGYLIYAMSAAFFTDETEMTLFTPLLRIFFQLVLLALVLILFRQVLKAWKIWWQWKDCIFELQPMPAYLGAKLQGKLSIPSQLISGSKIYCTLSCLRHGSDTKRLEADKRKRRRGVLLWESDTQKIPVMPSMKSIRIIIDLPKSRPESNWTDPDDRVKWILSVNEGMDYHNDIDYEVPVFFNPYEQ